MESFVEAIETSESESPNKFEPSTPVEFRERDSVIETDSSHQVESSQDEETSQEISSQAAPLSTAVVSSHEKSSQLSSVPSTSFEAILSASSEMENAPAPKRLRLDAGSMSSGAYLDATVVPILHVALINVDRLRPEDPVQFLADFLLKNKAKYSERIQSVVPKNEA